MSKHPLIFLLVLIFFVTPAKAQKQQDTVFRDATLEQCVQYALTHQPIINQSLLDENIIEAEIKTRLADWYPQLSLDYSLQHYFQVPRTTVSGGTTAPVAAENYSFAYFSLTQNIFNRDVLLASRTKN